MTRFDYSRNYAFFSNFSPRISSGGVENFTDIQNRLFLQKLFKTKSALWSFAGIQGYFNQNIKKKNQGDTFKNNWTCTIIWVTLNILMNRTVRYLNLASFSY